MHAFFITLIIIQLTDVTVVTSVFMTDIFDSIKLDLDLMDSIEIFFNLGKCFLLIGYYYIVAMDKKEKVSPMIEDKIPLVDPSSDT